MQPFFSTDPHVRATVVGSILGNLIFWVCTGTSDQMAIQRYLSTRDSNTARQAFFSNCIGTIVTNGVLMLIGFALLGFYQSHPQLMGDALDKTVMKTITSRISSPTICQSGFRA